MVDYTYHHIVLFSHRPRVVIESRESVTRSRALRIIRRLTDADQNRPRAPVTLPGCGCWMVDEISWAALSIRSRPVRQL